MEVEDAPGHVQEFFYKKLQTRPGQPRPNGSIFLRAVLHMMAERPNVELENMGWHLFEKSSLTLERQERVLRAAESEYDFTAV